MADDSDALFGLIIFILFLALLGYAAGGISSSPSTGTPSGTSPSYPPLSGGPVNSCMDPPRESVSNPTTPPNVTLTVYVSGSQTCATARFNPAGSSTNPARLTVRLAYAGNPTIAKSASIDHQLNETKMVSVLVTAADNLCLSAFAEERPPAPSQPTVASIENVNEPCEPTPATSPPAGPMPVPPAIDDKDDQEDGF